MATIAFQAAGFAVGGPVGGVIGAAIGSYVDNAWIMPALFPQDPVKGQTLQEMQLQGADEGHPINRCFSRRTRVAGAIIWTPRGFNSRTETESVGGKGGAGQEVENTRYSVDLAVAFCEGPPDGLGVDSVDRIYADATLIYDNTPNVNLSSTAISCTVREEYTQNPFAGDSWTPILDKKVLVLASPSTGADLSELLSGNVVVIDGWTETDYNDTLRCMSSEKANDGSSTAQFKLPITASSAGEGAGNTITLDQTNPKFDSSKVSNVTIHLGTEAQTKDSFIVGVETAANTSAYRGVVYAVFEGLELQDYGNRIPNFRGEVVVDSADDLQDVVEDLLQATDLDAAEWDTSALAGVSCKGYALRGPIPTTSAMQPLSTAFDVLAQDMDGVLTFFLRANADVVDVAENDLFAHVEGARGGPWPHRLDKKPDQDPPSEVLVKFSDEEKELGPGQQRERDPTARNLFEKKTVELNITMDGGEARDIAAKLLHTSRVGATEHEIVLPPSYAQVLENDVVRYSYEGETYRFLVQDVTDGADDTRVLTGFAELAANMTQNSPHEAPFSPDTHLSSAYDVRLESIDVGPLEAQTTQIPGMYFVAVSHQQGSTWQGAGLYQSLDVGVTWSLAGSFVTEGTVGYATTAIPKIHDAASWDRASTLVVVVEHGELSSVTELECLNGANRAVVGSELIGFKTATLSASQPSIGTSYDLTRLIRGLAGTEREMGIHQSGERFVLLSTLSGIFLEFNTSAVGSTRQYVGVSPGGDPDDFDAREVPLLANNARPLFPVHLFGERDAPATNDWTVTWTRRSRKYFRIFSQLAPLAEPSEDYIVEVLNGSEELVATYTSTLTASGSGVTGAQFVYDVVDQTTDFGSAQSTIRINVFQVSDLAGRGVGTGTQTFTG